MTTRRRGDLCGPKTRAGVFGNHNLPVAVARRPRVDDDHAVRQLGAADERRSPGNRHEQLPVRRVHGERQWRGSRCGGELVLRFTARVAPRTSPSRSA